MTYHNHITCFFSSFFYNSLSYTAYTFTLHQGTVLSAKFDDASVALGAALLANLPTTAVSSGDLEGSTGLSVAELEAARKAEVDMQVSLRYTLSCAAISSKSHCYVEWFSRVIVWPNWESFDCSDYLSLFYYDTESDYLPCRLPSLCFQVADEDIKLLLAGRNELESYLLEIRAAPRRKHGKWFLSARLKGCVMFCVERSYDATECH